MAAQIGITTVKRMTYRGDPTEEWSNTYWFKGTVPTTSAAWKTGVDSLIAQEAQLFNSNSKVVRAYGYNDDADDAVSVWSFDYLAAGTTVTGTVVSSGGTFPAGDQAAWLRWRVSRLNSRGRPIYLRKYYHGVPTDEDAIGTADAVGPGWSITANSVATWLQDTGPTGFGTLTARGHTDTILSHAVSQYITIRQLRKGSRRPPP